MKHALQALTIVFGGALAVVLLLTLQGRLDERIRAAEDAAVTQWFDELLPPDLDNQPLTDVIEVTAPELLGTARALPVLRARRDGALVAVVIISVAPDGYNGPLVLATGIEPDGRVRGMRVLGHRETPGYGAVLHQERSDWLAQAKGIRLDAMQVSDWRIERDGGRFDGLSGATITPYAVIRALRNTLIFADRRFEDLGAPPPVPAPDWRALVGELVRGG